MHLLYHEKKHKTIYLWYNPAGKKKQKKIKIPQYLYFFDSNFPILILLVLFLKIFYVLNDELHCPIDTEDAAVD